MTTTDEASLVTEEDLKFKRTVKAGAQAWQKLLELDPLLRAQTDRYSVAKSKLRAGVLAMLNDYATKHEEEQMRDPFPISEETTEHMRIDARDNLVAEIMNTDNLPLHYGIPENELSEIAFWVLSEAIEAMWTDDRAWKETVS